MAKVKKASQEASLPLGLRVKEAEFIRACSTAISKALPVKHVQPVTISKGFAEKSVRYASTESERYVGDAPSLPVVDSDKDYRVTVRLEFEHGPGACNLTEVFLHFFKFPLTGEGDPLMFLRAEWDFRPQIKEHTHAQPHWHLVMHDAGSELATVWSPTDASKDIPSFASSVAANEPSTDTTIDQAPDVARLHLAMAATWHLAPPDGKHVLAVNDPESVSRWLSGVLLYLRQQVEYMIRKA